jgi:hypothetical protein
MGALYHEPFVLQTRVATIDHEVDYAAAPSIVASLYHARAKNQARSRLPVMSVIGGASA